MAPTRPTTPQSPDSPGSRAAQQNRAYYDGESAGRDDYWRKMAAPRHRVDVLRREVARLRPRAIVDLGCGNGALLGHLARALRRGSNSQAPGWQPAGPEPAGPEPAGPELAGPELGGLELAGVDLSDVRLAENRAAMPAVTWYAGDLETAITWPEPMVGRYDAVLCSEVIEHLDHPRAMLQNALALARPGRGRLVLSTQSGPIRETERRVGHRRHYTADELRHTLRDSGWLPLRVWNTGFPFHDLSKWYANRDPDGSMERFGGQSYGWSEELICLGLRLAFRLNSSRRGAQLFATAIAPGGPG